MTPLQSLVASGTKLWLDSVDPDEIASNRALGATGATSNPIIISDLSRPAGSTPTSSSSSKAGQDDEAIAWAMTDKLVKEAQAVFEPVWTRDARQRRLRVSFELDPLLEDPARNVPVAERTKQYIELGKKWSAGHKNRHDQGARHRGRPGGAGGTGRGRRDVNVTLIFTERQYIIARDAFWRGIQRRKDTRHASSPSTASSSAASTCTPRSTCPTCRRRRRGMVGIVNAKHIWQLNQRVLGRTRS